ncbi:MAG TPA: hypothetical protein VHX36_16950 [Candidatus Acidoferrales bacterium]|jgi:hypothetical protein|nr:hypothetical protein [Candidatus Acidoferrales bacterium]
MRTQFILIAGLFLGTFFPAAAQTPRMRTILASATPRAAAMPSFRPVRAPSSAVLPDKPLPRFSSSLAPAYKPEPSLVSRLPIDEFRTPLMMESSVPIVHLWRGLGFDVFESTLYSHSLQRGSPESGVAYQDLRPVTRDQAALAGSFGGDGVSLRYTFGRDASAAKPVQMWHCASLIVGEAHGCPL